MWNVMNLDLDFLWVCFFSSEHPVTVVLEDAAHLPTVCRREQTWGSTVFCFPLERWGKEKGFGLVSCMSRYLSHTVCSLEPWSGWSGVQSPWHVILVWRLLQMSSFSSSSFSGKSSHSIQGWVRGPIWLSHSNPFLLPRCIPWCSSAAIEKTFEQSALYLAFAAILLYFRDYRGKSWSQEGHQKILWLWGATTKWSLIICRQR